MPANPAFSQWMYLDPWGQQTGGTPGSASKTYPLLGVPEPWFRDRVDALRAARIPSAEYPDGYLATVRTRRQDRLQAHRGRVNQRNYQRGIHVGARVDPQSYFWTPEFNDKVGLENQALTGQRWAPLGDPETHLVNSGKGVPRGGRSLAGMPPPARVVGTSPVPHSDEERRLYLKRLAPAWR